MREDCLGTPGDSAGTALVASAKLMSKASNAPPEVDRVHPASLGQFVDNGFGGQCGVASAGRTVAARLWAD